jgi:hypothetical protein
MSIINKISDTEYEVGKYLITARFQNPWSATKWTLIEDDKYIAEFYDKHTAIAWANLNYICGHMVSESVRELLKLVWEEEPA